MELSKELMKELHEELWLEGLAEDPYMEKHEWSRWKRNGGSIPHVAADCFPCEYTVQHGRLVDGPCRCPLDFPGWDEANGSVVKCLGGLYSQWNGATGTERLALAKQIGELPLRQEED